MRKRRKIIAREKCLIKGVPVKCKHVRVVKSVLRLLLVVVVVVVVVASRNSSCPRSQPGVGRSGI